MRRVVNVGDIIMMLQATPIGHIRYVNDTTFEREMPELYSVDGESLECGDFVMILATMNQSDSRFVVMTPRGYIGTALITRKESMNSLAANNR